VCLEAAAGALQQLEGVAPGSCSRLLCEAMLQLSINSTPDLQQLQAAAASMFGGSSSAGLSSGPAAAAAAAAAAAGGGGDRGSTLQQLDEEGDEVVQSGRTTSGQQQQQGKIGSSTGSALAQPGLGGAGVGSVLRQQQHQQQQQRPGMDCVVLQGVGQLGPLGSYLLARWREDVARSAAAAAQGPGWQVV